MASIARNGAVGKAALTNTHFVLLYCAMLVASSGNTALQSVPTNVIAGATGFTRREFYRIEDDADREPVAVKLGT